MAKQVEREVRWLEQRCASLEGVQRFMFSAQLDSLDKAERLRRLARALVRSKWQHRCSDKVGGCMAVSASKLEELEDYLKELNPFGSTSKRVRTKMENWIKRGKQGKGT